MNKNKGKPATKEQREARAAGLRKAWAEGRIKIIRTPEQIEKTASKLRGRKRPPEVVAKVRAANIGKKRTPEQIEAFSKLVKTGYAEGKYRPSKEGAERKRIASIAFHTGRKHSEEQIRKQAEAMRGRKYSPEIVEKRVVKMRGREQKAPLTARGPTNKQSREGALRDPNGRIWWYRNLTHFVRTHEELFSPDDVAWVPTRRGGLHLRCRAQKGLTNLYGRGKSTAGQWKGWTIADSTIERTMGCADLLGRDEATIPWEKLKAELDAKHKIA
jgi:hypothetical protein